MLSEDGALRLVKGAKAMALGYDPNGNMTSRVVEGLGYVASYDAENRLVEVRKSGGLVASFVYDGDGKRVKGEVGGVATTYIGDYYEWTGSVGTMKSTYAAGGVRVAMREAGVLYWLLTDHLGSTAITANGTNGAKVGEVRYRAWGEERPACLYPPCGTIPTTYRYTGQRWESGIGLYFYNARWYDPALGRFVQPDTVVPSPFDPQSLNRFAYVRNNPLRYMDPSGHYEEEGTGMEDYELIPLDELLRMDREVALRYLSNYLRAKFGIVPAAGVMVRYAGVNVQDPTVLAENVDRGNEDMYINVYEGAFTEAGTTADILGILVHEITHSHQEQWIEAKHNNPDIWVQPSGFECQIDVDKVYESVGERYQAEREIEALQAALDLEPWVTYSDKFRHDVLEFNKEFWENALSTSSKFCPKGFWYTRIP